VVGQHSKSNLLGRGTAEFMLQAAAIRLSLALKAGYRPQQPRVPRGNTDGGQWTLVPGYARVERVSRRRAGASQIQVGGVWHQVTPAQQVLLAQSATARNIAVQAVRQLDPNWQPPVQVYSTPNGMIAANRAVEQAARLRIFEVVGGPMGIGPYAREWVPAPTSNRRLYKPERLEIDRIGRQFGCHRCGTRNPATPSNMFIGDHQVPTSIGTPARIYPHCFSCSASQGGMLRHYPWRRR
jgi:hypothetical protein